MHGGRRGAGQLRNVHSHQVTHSLICPQVVDTHAPLHGSHVCRQIWAPQFTGFDSLAHCTLSSDNRPLSHTLLHTHTRAHSRNHRYKHTAVCLCTIDVCKYMDTHIYTLMRTHICEQVCVHKYTYICTHIYMLMHTYMCMCVCCVHKYTYMCVHTHIHLHIFVHKCMYTNIHTYVHTHVHTYAHIYICA